MTDCSMCGDCCEDLALNIDRGRILQRLADNYGTAGWRKDAVFIINNMLPTGKVVRHGNTVKQVLSCQKFDTETRKCTAHDDRPYLCEGYPWYSKAPKQGDTTMKGRCSFLADAYKMLPIVEVR